MAWVARCRPTLSVTLKGGVVLESANRLLLLPPAPPPQAHDMGSLTLLEGAAYYITVIATNRAGPRLSANASSAAVAVDTSPPLPAAVYNTCAAAPPTCPRCLAPAASAAAVCARTGFHPRASALPLRAPRSDAFEQRATTSAVRHLGASWDSFSDPQSNISAYFVQFFSQPPDARARRSRGNGGGEGAGAAPDGDAPPQIDTSALSARNDERDANLTDLINVGLANRWGQMGLNPLPRTRAGRRPAPRTARALCRAHRDAPPPSAPRAQGALPRARAERQRAVLCGGDRRQPRGAQRERCGPARARGGRHVRGRAAGRG